MENLRPEDTELPFFVTDESWDSFQAAGFYALEVLPKDEADSRVGARIPNKDSQKRLAEIEKEYGRYNVRTGAPFAREGDVYIVGTPEELSYPATTFGVYVRKHL